MANDRSPNVFMATLYPDRMKLDRPRAYQEWIALQHELVQEGKSGTRFVITVEEQWSREAKDFYFQILKWMRTDGEMSGWTEAEQHRFFKDQFNDGRSIQELSRQRFEEFLESVIQWCAEHGYAVPEADKHHRWKK